MVSKRNLHGFTIVELIIVIAIISILATIGMVSWSGAQNTAKQNAAKSTLAKMKLSLSDYFTETNTYPVDKNGICDTPDHDVIPAGELYSEFCDDANAVHYLYDALPASCDNSATPCNSYELTAEMEIWGGSTDETLGQ